MTAPQPPTIEAGRHRLPAGLIHDLRTPLNQIIGYSALLVEQAQEQGQNSFVPDLERTQVAGQELLALINNHFQSISGPATPAPYPLESEIVELGAVKWHHGKIIERYQTLLKPSRPLMPENIKIHGISNEMVAEAPEMKSEIAKFCQFIDGSVLLAHHAPFDLGFLAIEIEKAGLAFPSNLQICTSLLSRAVLTTTNHKLQTLVKELGLTGGAAHRAYDDAYACLQVFFKSCEKLGDDVSLRRILEVQKKRN